MEQRSIKYLIYIFKNIKSVEKYTGCGRTPFYVIKVDLNISNKGNNMIFFFM